MRQWQLLGEKRTLLESALGGEQTLASGPKPDMSCGLNLGWIARRRATRSTQGGSGIARVVTGPLSVAFQRHGAEKTTVTRRTRHHVTPLFG